MNIPCLPSLVLTSGVDTNSQIAINKNASADLATNFWRLEAGFRLIMILSGNKN
ncbi:hypothetical protein Pan189_06190 [Stratiformator vulcanicus]|uniref:Uncharacterized protein n=1 Tax=Stratiformator vulcanicus TaxID=2527980 RepID=A0A517QXE9_9PLAN|nr:hypothetical protein Pan189_06190 [Stratiformator vulcanicus]